jgi:hypothetical protein
MFLIWDLIEAAYRNVHDPRALAAILEKAEADLAARRHPDPYIRKFVFSYVIRLLMFVSISAAMFPGGTKWCVDSIRLVLFPCSYFLRERNIPVCISLASGCGNGLTRDSSQRWGLHLIMKHILPIDLLLSINLTSRLISEL